MKTQEEKDLLLADLKHHQELDAFVQGVWLQDQKIEGTGFKGCFYGCTMQTDQSPREKFAEKHAIDLWYVYITERIFEGLPKGEFERFPYQSIELLPLNYDFDIVKSAFHKTMLLKQLDWIIDENVRSVLVDTSKLFDVPFSQIDKSASEAARSASEAAEWPARSAKLAAESAKLAAESAKWSAKLAAESVEWSAESAAESAARSARSAAKQNYYVWMRDNLFELIRQNS